jgi:hypothetical protein
VHQSGDDTAGNEGSREAAGDDESPERPGRRQRGCVTVIQAWVGAGACKVVLVSIPTPLVFVGAIAPIASSMGARTSRVLGPKGPS